MEKMILTTVPLNELLEGIRALVKEELKAEQQQELAEKLISPDEACKLFSPKISRVTLQKWTTDGHLPEPVRKGNRLYYRYSDIIQASTVLKRFKRKPNDTSAGFNKPD